MSEEHTVLGDNAKTDPLLGTVLAERYRIERKLGEGGMGAVYLAKHVIIEKLVALKILHDEYARRRELVERFLHEAKAASRIRHEHVIDITDFGETQTKNVFFAMEFLDGHDLAFEIDRKGALPWPRIKSIALQICAALQAAHEAGVIHRDLKPENIYLIERAGNSDYVKVLDFGVAKLTETEEGHNRRLTRTGMVFGTPEYMSPEQARGEKPDTRVDVYAIGCILFEMVTGDVPFRADNFMGVLTKHLFDPMPLLSERTARTDFPKGLQDVISQAMSKDKSQRFATMNELAVALDTLDATHSLAYGGARVDSGRRLSTRGRSERPGIGEPSISDSATTGRHRMLSDDDAIIDDSRIPTQSRRGLIAIALGLLLGGGALVAWQLVGRSAAAPSFADAAASPHPSVPSPVVEAIASPDATPVDAALLRPPVEPPVEPTGPSLPRVEPIVGPPPIEIPDAAPSRRPDRSHHRRPPTGPIGSSPTSPLPIPEPPTTVVPPVSSSPPAMTPEPEPLKPETIKQPELKDPFSK